MRYLGREIELVLAGTHREFIQYIRAQGRPPDEFYEITPRTVRGIWLGGEPVTMIGSWHLRPDLREILGYLYIAGWDWEGSVEAT